MSRYIVVGLSDEGVVQFDEGKNTNGPWSTDPGKAHIYKDIKLFGNPWITAEEWAAGRAETLRREGGSRTAIAVDLLAHVDALSAAICT